MDSMNAPLIDPEAIAKEIGERKDEIVKGVVTRLITEIGQQVDWSLKSEISNEVAKIVKEEMQEDIKAAVQAAKPIVLDEVKNACAKVSANIGSAMAAKAGANIELSWKLRELLKAMFE